MNTKSLVLPGDSASPGLVTLPESAVAGLLGISVKTLRNRRIVGDGPVAVRLSNSRVVDLPEDVYAYLRSHRVANDTAALVAAEPVVPVKRGRGRPKGSITRRNGEG